MSLFLDSGAKGAMSVSGVAECMGSGTNFIRLLPIGSRSLFKTSCKPTPAPPRLLGLFLKIVPVFCSGVQK